MNKVILIGNLGKDPEEKVINDSTKITKVSLCTTESYKDTAGEWQNKNEWHNLIAWNQRSESLAKMMKGELVSVEGKITTRKWQDTEGVDKYTTEIIVQSIKRLSKRDAAPNSAPSSAQYNGAFG